MNAKELMLSIKKGHSLLRAYENDYVKNINIMGTGIDLGAKSKDAKYYEYFDLSDVLNIDFIDYYSGGDGVVKLDLEKPFEIESNKYDFVLMFNVMEHIYNYKNLLDESIRILKPGGKLHGLVPFMWHYHPDPSDYFRFTEHALKRIIEREGLSELEVIPICYGPFKVAAVVIGAFVGSKILKIPLYLFAVFLDSLLDRVSSRAKNYVLGYYFSASKHH